MAFCWRADYGPLMYLDLDPSSLLQLKNSKKTKMSKLDPLWQNYLDLHMWWSARERPSHDNEILMAHHCKFPCFGSFWLLTSEGPWGRAKTKCGLAHSLLYSLVQWLEDSITDGWMDRWIGQIKISPNAFYLHRFSESRSSNGSTPTVCTYPRYIMRFAICTAVFSEIRIRLGLVQYGVLGLNRLVGLTLWG